MSAGNLFLVPLVTRSIAWKRGDSDSFGVSQSYEFWKSKYSSFQLPCVSTENNKKLGQWISIIKENPFTCTSGVQTSELPKPPECPHCLLYRPVGIIQVIKSSGKGKMTDCAIKSLLQQLTTVIYNISNWICFCEPKPLPVTKGNPTLTFWHLKKIKWLVL